MKTPAMVPWSSPAVATLCLGAWMAFPPVLKSQPAATVPIVTNPPPGHAAAQFIPPPPKSLVMGSTNPVPPGEITTLDGKIYRQVTVQRVDPDGLTIGYAVAGGGAGAAKVKFKNLSDALRRQYHYDPDKAAAFEARQAQGMAAWRSQQQQAEKAAKRAAQQQVEQDALEQQQKEELAAGQKKAPPEMTEDQKKEAQKQIEATWSGFTSSVKAGRITN